MFFKSRWKEKLNKIYENRESISKEGFLLELEQLKLNKTIASTFYDKVYHYLPKDDHKSIRLTDNPKVDFDIDVEDLETMIVETFDELKIQIPPISEQKAYYDLNGDLDTVVDCIKIIDHFNLNSDTP